MLKRVDQLDGWVDRAGEKPLTKKGAFVYALNIRFRKLGELALSTAARVVAHASATVRGTATGSA